MLHKCNISCILRTYIYTYTCVCVCTKCANFYAKTQSYSLLSLNLEKSAMENAGRKFDGPRLAD